MVDYTTSPKMMAIRDPSLLPLPLHANANKINTFPGHLSKPKSRTGSSTKKMCLMLSKKVFSLTNPSQKRL